MRVVPPLTGRLDMALSNFAKGYRNADLITDILFPRLEVSRQRDLYWVFGRENMQLTEQTLRAIGTPAAETRFQLSTDSYQCDSRALKSIIPDEERLAYQAGDLDMDAVSLNMDKILLDREYRAMSLVTNAANYAAGNTVALANGAQWDQAGGDPIGIARIARTIIAKSAGVRANLLVLAFDVAEALRTSPELLVRFQYTTATGALSDQQLALVLNVDKIIIGGAVTNNPLTGVSDFVWKNFALFCYNTPTVGTAGVIGAEGKIGPKQLSFGKSFTWVGGPQTVGGYGTVISRVADPTAKSDLVGVDWYSDEKIVAADCGYLVTNVLANP